MKKIRLLAATFFFLSSFFSLRSQSYLSLSTGIARDANNPIRTFYQVPIILTCKPSLGVGGFILELDYDPTFTAHGRGNAYTLNPALPSEVTLPEAIHAYAFTTSIGFRIPLLNKNLKRWFLEFLPLGISSQQFVVRYEHYDKSNYEVLNPDVNFNPSGLVWSIATSYTLNRIWDITLRYRTPIWSKGSDYPLSYRCFSPVQLTAGYRFIFNKKK